jgi:predicted lysophospholipase L1 biosynthesis ABC-type transport system permease subunit
MGRSAEAVAATIVGMSPTIPQFPIPGKLGNPPDAVVYAPLERGADAPATVSLIVRGDARAVVGRVREELRALDPDLPVYFVRSMSDAAGDMQFQVQGILRLFGFFAVIAFVLAAVGLYGVTSHAVTQRTAEIGVRMALGAQRSAVVWLFLRRTLVQVAVGLVIGLAAAYAVGRVLESALVQTNARDPLTFACVAALLVVVSCAAAWIPARRAARLDPAVTLRYE